MYQEQEHIKIQMRILSAIARLISLELALEDTVQPQLLRS